jgi:hypothetical protein
MALFYSILGVNPVNLVHKKFEIKKDFNKVAIISRDSKFSGSVLHEGDAGPECGQVSGAGEIDPSPYAWGAAQILELLTQTSARDCYQSNMCLYIYIYIVPFLPTNLKK